MTAGPFTLVSFHAHPDDEVLLTGGTLARAAAEGHRVVLVVATDGGAGLASDVSEQRPSTQTPAPQTTATQTTATATQTLGARRIAELRASAQTLGCARVEVLGYADSGSAGTPGPGAFCLVPVESAAAALAAILREERADAVTIYDPMGGYGHADHIQVHRVGVRAAQLAGTAVVLEATADRRWLRAAAAVLRRAAAVRSLARPGHGGAAVFQDAFTEPARLTHRVDVRAYADRKRAAMSAHASQATGGDGARTLTLLLRLPRPVFRRLLGREWFVQHGVPAPGRAHLSDDIFASLRGAP